ncbi:MAG: TonB-dependent receptor [Pseudobacteriovorax sp.]|nr:TonB-dependent receptor [Pseudobacteriovorax sp.]
MNYGLGVKWEVVEGLALRSRTASSYKAPTLTDLHQLGGGGYFTVNDDKWCDREREENRVCNPDNPSRQVYVDSPGNKELDPEVGVNYISGIIYEPMSGLVLIGDYYDITLEKTFQTDSLQEIVDRWYRDNPGNTTGGEVTGNPIGVDSQGIITTVGTPVRNLGKTEVHAAQLKLNYSTKLADVRMALSSQYFRMISFKEQESQESEIRQIKGFIGTPAWRHNHNLSLGYDSHSINLSAQVIAKQVQDPLLANDNTRGTSIAEHKEYDASYTALLPWDGSLQIGVNNIFDSIGGVRRANGIGEERIATTSIYSATGRTYFARITQRF